MKNFCGVPLIVFCLAGVSAETCHSAMPEDCADIKIASPSASSGVYTIRLKGGGCSDVPAGIETLTGTCCVETYCDMDRFGGGWTIFQKRQDGTVNFNQNWMQYEHGFGFLLGEFYSGNRFLYYFTNRKTYELLVELDQGAENCSVYAYYSSFIIMNTDFYNLSLGSYINGTAGDSLKYHNGMGFSTNDKDNDAHSSAFCANVYNGAWWYNKCHASHLNGVYHDGCSSVYAKMMVWTTSRGYYYSFKGSEMKLRPAGFR